MYYFEKNPKKFSPERPRENVWGPSENVSPGPAVALDGPAKNIPNIFGCNLKKDCQILIIFITNIYETTSH